VVVEPLCKAPDARRLAVLGLGYVGCVTAACMARIGHRVVGVDRDPFKVESVLAGRAPFFEPGLEELVRAAVGSGRLSASLSLAEAVRDADVALLCVGTPSGKHGDLCLDQLRRVCQELAALLPARTRRLVVAVRSTVYPGTCEQVVEPALGNPTLAAVVANPEFLREGAAVKDFMEPSLLVAGGGDPSAVEQVAALYTSLGVQPALVSLRAAEFIKYACNAFHAVKIAFANEIGALAAESGIDGREIMDTLCRDVSLNLSAAYLKPGFAFGGSCLPKDLRALVHRASRFDLNLPLLGNVLPSNHAHLERAISLALELPGERLGVFGLAFKENTDDLRESPVVHLLETLIGKGRKVRVFDPHIQLDGIYGSNQRYLMNAIPHIGSLLDGSLESMLQWADHVVVAQKPPAGLMAVLEAGGKPLLDLVGVLPHAYAIAARSPIA
jgi:GDP-mannose 6-dehydrogenase